MSSIMFQLPTIWNGLRNATGIWLLPISKNWQSKSVLSYSGYIGIVCFAAFITWEVLYEFISQSSHNCNLEHVSASIFMSNHFMHRYPPGHGDVFSSLMNSGKLDALLSQVDSRTQFIFNWFVFWFGHQHTYFFLSYLFSYRVRSMCLLPIQITWVLQLT